MYLWIRARIHRAWALLEEGGLDEDRHPLLTGRVAMVPAGVALYESPEGLVRFVDPGAKQLVELTETMDEFEARCVGHGVILSGSVPMAPNKKRIITGTQE